MTSQNTQAADQLDGGPRSYPLDWVEEVRNACPDIFLMRGHWHGSTKPFKCPRDRGWQGWSMCCPYLGPESVSDEEMAEAPLVGFVPGTANLYGIDVDEGGRAAAEALLARFGPSARMVPTRQPGGYHVLVKVDLYSRVKEFWYEHGGLAKLDRASRADAVGLLKDDLKKQLPLTRSGKWGGVPDTNGGSGDIRCVAGLLWIWSPEAFLVAVQELADAEIPAVPDADLMPFCPKPKGAAVPVPQTEEGGADTRPNSQLYKDCTVYAMRVLANINLDAPGRHDVLMSKTSAIARRCSGLDEQEQARVKALIKTSLLHTPYKKGPMQDNDLDRQINNAWSYGIKRPNSPPNPDSGNDGSVPGQPFPRKNSKALAGALKEEGYGFRYNLRAAQSEVWVAGEWEALTDRLADDLREQIAEKYCYQTTKGVSPLRFGRDSWQAAVNALGRRTETDPFRSWLESLPAWDGIVRLDSLIQDAFRLAEADPIATWISRFMIGGAITRTLQPGFKFDVLPILLGNQGIGKSTLIRELLPPEIPGLFSETLTLNDTSQKQVESMLGAVICELAELAGRSRADIGKMKAFLSRLDDKGVRLAYRRNPEPMPRRCIFVGTENNPSCVPNDPSGNRRFCPFWITPGEGHMVAKMVAFCRENREQLWAEGLAKYSDGERFYMRGRLEKVASERATIHRDRDHLYEDYVANIPLAVTYGKTLQLAFVAGLVESRSDGRPKALTRSEAYGFQQALRNAGWVNARCRRDGLRAYFWLRPTITEESGQVSRRSRPVPWNPREPQKTSLFVYPLMYLRVGDGTGDGSCAVVNTLSRQCEAFGCRQMALAGQLFCADHTQQDDVPI